MLFGSDLPIPVLIGTKPQNYEDSAFPHRIVGCAQKAEFQRKIALKINNWSVKTCDYKTFGILDVLGLWHPGKGPIA